jgi:hypothetical protein
MNGGNVLWFKIFPLESFANGHGLPESIGSKFKLKSDRRFHKNSLGLKSGKRRAKPMNENLVTSRTFRHRMRYLCLKNCPDSTELAEY